MTFAELPVHVDRGSAKLRISEPGPVTDVVRPRFPLNPYWGVRKIVELLLLA